LFRAPPRLERISIPSLVFICLVLLALAPFSGFVVGKLVTHAFEPRYAFLCAIGLLPLIAIAIRDAARRSALWMAVAVLILGSCASLVRYHAIRGMPSNGDPLTFADTSVFFANPSLPIVPDSDGLFLRIESHAPPSLRNRCIFPTDPDFVRFLHQNTNYLMTEALRRWTQLPIVDLSSFLSFQRQFYFIQLPGGHSWLIGRLMEGRANMSLQGIYDGNPVYLVDVGQ
jgi:hypothetical protein